MEGKWRCTSLEICRTVRVQVTLSWILVNHILFRFILVSALSSFIVLNMLHNVCFIYCCNFPVHQSASVIRPDVNNLYHTMSVRSLINVEMLIGLNSINFTIKRIATQMSIEWKYRAALHFNTTREIFAKVKDIWVQYSGISATSMVHLFDLCLCIISHYVFFKNAFKCIFSLLDIRT